MKYKSIFFDFDGTLFDTIVPISKAVNLTLKHFKIPRSYTENQVKNFVGNGSRIVLEKAFKGVPYKEKDMDKILKYYLSTQEKTHNIICNPFDGILDILKILKKKKINLFIVTNKPKKILELVINKELLFFFKECISFDERFDPKPSPESCEYLIKKYKLNKKEILFVGDSSVDQETAKNAKLNFLYCSYGYGKIKNIDPKFLIKKPKELLRYFK